MLSILNRILALAVLFLVAHQVYCFDSQNTRLIVDSINYEGILLDNWKFHPGDNMDWAHPEFDDSTWGSINPSNDVAELSAFWDNGICWMRLTLSMADATINNKLALLIEQTGASEIFLDGQLMKKYGSFSNGTSGAKAALVRQGEFIPLQLDAGRAHVVAIRFELQKGIPYVNFANWKNRPVVISLIEIQSLPYFETSNYNIKHYIEGAVFLILAVLHLVLILTGSRQKENFSFFLFCLANALNFSLCAIAIQCVDQVATWIYVVIFMYVLCTASYFFFLRSVYATFNRRAGIVFKCIFSVYVLSIPAFLFYYDYGWMSGLVLLPTLVFFEAIRISFSRIDTQKYRIRVVRYGAAGFIGLYLLSLALYFGVTPIGYNTVLGDITFTMAFLSVPVALSVKLAIEMSLTNRVLVSTVAEVKHLNEKASEREAALQQMQDNIQRNSRILILGGLVNNAVGGELQKVSADDRLVNRVLSVVEENLSNASFDVNVLCRQVGISRAQLNRRLNELVGQSPAEFIRTFRLKRAAVLLRKQTDNISTVAFMVGYSNPAHFSKAFRDFYGVTPTEYISNSVSSPEPGNVPLTPRLI